MNYAYHTTQTQTPFVNNCFPVRYNLRIRGPDDDNGGAWMVVYRNTQKKQLKAVLCSQSKTFEDVRKQRQIAEAHGIPISRVELTKEQTPSVSARLQLGKTLSKRWLMKHLKIMAPNDLAVAHIESCDLARVDDSEMSEFVNVIHVKAADNLLPIHAFSKFPALEILEMQMNCIGSASSVSFFSDDSASLLLTDIYPNLKQLVLDYNDLASADFDALSYLNNLESLSVVGNRLSTLPAPDYQRLEANLFFPKLSILDVSENPLNSEADFLYLCGMPKLQQLNMTANGIKGIPSINFTGHRYAIVPTRHNFEKSPRMLNLDLNAAGELEDIGEESARALSTIAETTSERSTPALLLLPPFPELTVVNLSNNLIRNDMSLAGVLSWPSLKQVILDGNPIAKRDEKVKRTSKSSSKQQKPNHTDTASSICEFLEQSLGISVVRSKTAWPQNNSNVPKSTRTTSSVLRKYPHLEAKIPKVPKCDVDKLLALCAPPSQLDSEITTSEPSVLPAEVEKVDEERIKEAKQETSGSDANIQFFMTELAPDIDGAQIRAECEKALNEPKNETIAGTTCKAVVIFDPRFKGFEELFTPDEDNNAIIEREALEMPTTLQESVHALRNMLELPSVSRRPVAAIEAWANRQMASRRKLSNVSSSANGIVRSDRQPMRYEPYVPKHAPLGPPQTRTYTQVVDDIAVNLKKRETVAEAPLGTLLHDGRSRNPKMYRSAQRLLRQITQQYDRLRKDIDKAASSSRGSGGDDVQ